MATTETLTTGRVVGTSVPRKEDRKLVTGNGQFIDNINLPGQVWLAVVRSPTRTRGSAGSTSPRRARCRGSSPRSAARSSPPTGPARCRARGRSPRRSGCRRTSRSPSTRRVTGDGVAVVVAETRSLAKDAAELVEVEYEPLGAVTEVAHALDDGAPLVHDDLGTNECYVWKLDAGEVDRAFADADVTVKRSYRQQRLIPAAMEPRGALAQELPGTDELTLWSSTQIPHIAASRCGRGRRLRGPAARDRADVGGGFGSKLDVYAEEALCLALARRLHRPVKWIEERMEGSTRPSTAATFSRR